MMGLLRKGVLKTLERERERERERASVKCSAQTLSHRSTTWTKRQFSKEEFASDFLVLKDTLEMRNDPISVLHPLAKLLEGGSTRVGNYDIYKQICSSPISRVLFADQAEAVGIRWKTEVEGETEKPEMACLSERISGNPNSNFSSKIVTSKKGEVVKDLDCKFSCEHVLDSLYVIQSPHGKQTRTV